jgi:uncharacterized SAM-binding protein YcdF (DUF218 family)
MIYLIRILYTTFLMPPGIFIIALGMVSAWLYRKTKRGAAVLAGITLVFYAASTGIIAGSLLRPLESRYTPPTAVRGDVIILLGGGATLDTPNIGGEGHLSGYAANRLLTAAQLYYMLKAPVIVSGGKVLETTGNEAEIAKRTLTALGIPADRIIVENKSLNTTQNAEYTKQLLDQYGFQRPILVTSAFHMERAVRQFAKAGQAVVPFPTDYQTNTEMHVTIDSLLPTAGDLANTQVAVKEYIGLLASRWY